MRSINPVLLAVTLLISVAMAQRPVMPTPPAGSPPQPSAAPPSSSQTQPRATPTITKTKKETEAADKVAELFRRARAEQNLAPLKRITTLDTNYLCAPNWVKPYPGYEKMRDWLDLADYLTREPGNPSAELTKLATYHDGRHAIAKRFSVEVCATGRAGEYRVVAAIWRSAWQTNLGRIPVCRDDFGLWPFCSM